MKKNELFLKRLTAEILSELREISRLHSEYKAFLRKYSPRMDKFLLRAKASYMADFYIGAEKIMRLIAEELDGGVPAGEKWHKKLIHSMTIEIPGVRPAIFSKGLYHDLLKFLGFRHVVRQAYGFELDRKKLEGLEADFDKTFKEFSREIRQFCRFLEGKTTK
jgi:hypothetical protein